MNGLTLRISPECSTLKSSSREKKKDTRPVVHVSHKHMMSAELFTGQEKNDFISLLHKLSSAKGVEVQMTAVKELLQKLGKLQSNDNTAWDVYLGLAIDLYLSAPLKHPIKCALSKALNGLSLEMKLRAVSLLRDGLNSRMGNTFCTDTFTDLSAIISSLLGCYENLSIGPSAINSNLQPVFCFLENALNTCMRTLRNSTTPILKMETCKIAHSITRILILALQNTDSEANVSQTADELLRNILNCSRSVMQNSEVPLDTRSNCGIIIVLILASLEGEDGWIQLVDMPKQEIVKGVDLNDEISCLAICSGLLSTLTWQQLTLCEPVGHKSILSCILRAILCIHNSGIQESSIVLSIWRSVQQLTRELRDHSELVKHIEKNQLENLLEHLWGQLDHYMDTVRHIAWSVLENMTHVKDALSGIGLDLCGKIADAALQLPETKRSRYVALSVMASNLGTAEILRRVPTIVDMLLTALLCPTAAPHASSAMVSMISAHMKEVPETDWINLWILPLLSLMQRHEASVTTFLEEVLSKAVKICPSVISRVLPKVCRNGGNNTPELKTMLTCLKIGRKQGVIVSKLENDDEQMWHGVVPYEVLQTALCHQNDEVRIAALALIVETHRSTEALTVSDLRLVQYYLEYNINHDVPATRQQSLALILKLLMRLRDSALALHRLSEQKKGEEVQATALLQIYNKHLLWLVTFCFDNLTAGSNFSRRCCSLKILTSIQNMIGQSLPLGGADWQTLMWSEGNAHTLLGVILVDTFEDNKSTATKLLQTFPPNKLGLDKNERLLALFQSGCTLASSIHPANCISAAYVMELCVNIPNASSSLVSCDFLREDGQSKQAAIYHAVQKLLLQLETELHAAERSIFEAASSGPMYGTLFCIRHLMQQIENLSNLKNKPLWQNLLQSLISLCFRLNNAVAPVVNSSSPEGHLPMDLLPGHMPELAHLREPVPPAPVKVTAQMVLLCSWRTVKEVSLFLGELSERCPILPNCDGLLTGDQILDIGKHLTTLLEETKHRGAFEQAYIGFSHLAARLWRHPSDNLHQLPQQWLDELMNTIQSTDSNISKLCATRRSAGVPFLVQALVSAELQTGAGPQAFQKSMSLLLQLAADLDKHVECRTHALNILRALFRHALLAEHVLPFVSQGFMVAISGFRGKSWAERNSATLLFSSLMTRVFGVQRSRGELGWRNKMTGRIFFHRNPELYGYLLKELERAVVTLHTCNAIEVATLYPVLLLLARLYPSSLEGTDSTMQLGTFVPLVRQCSGSIILKNRCAAAEAIVPLVAANSFVSYIDDIVKEVATGCPENLAHGLLMQGVHLLKNTSTLNPDLLSCLNQHLGSWLSQLVRLQNKATSFPVLQSFMQMTEIVVEKWYDLIPTSVWSTVKEFLLKALDNTMKILPDCEPSIGLSVCQARAARLLLQMCIQSSSGDTVCLVEQLLSHKSSEVVQEALVFIEGIGGRAEFCDMDEEDEGVLVDLNDDRGHWTERLPGSTLPGIAAHVHNNTRVVQALALWAASNQGLRSRLALRALVHISPSAWHSSITLEKLWDLCQSSHEGNSCAALACLTSFLRFSIDNVGTIPEVAKDIGKLLWDFCSDERSDASRMVAVNFLLQHRSALERKYKFLSDVVVCELWMCAFKLTTDDDLGVRKKAAQLASYQVTAVPRRVQELLVEEFVSLMRSSSQCKATLVALALGSLPEVSESEAVEERVFDKGEINLFNEQLMLNEVACRNLLDFISPPIELSRLQLNWIFDMISGTPDEGIISEQSLFDNIRLNLFRAMELSDVEFLIPVPVANALCRLSKVEKLVLGSSIVPKEACFPYKIGNVIGT